MLGINKISRTNIQTAEMDSPPALSQAFKIKAGELRDVVLPYLPADLKLGLSLLEAMSPDSMTRAFCTYVAIHSGEIKERNTDFFLSDSVGTDPVLMALKGAWPTLPADKQESIWGLLPMLCNISKRYVRLAGAK